MPDEVPPRVKLYVGAVATGGAAATLVAASLLPRETAWLAQPWNAALVAGLGGLCILFLTFPVAFYWRGHRTMLSLEDASFYLGMALLPPATFVVTFSLANLVNQVVERRPRLKGIYNIGAFALMMAIGMSIVVAAERLGVPRTAGALLGALMASVLLDLSLANVLARLEGRPVVEVFSSMLPTTAVQAPAGAAIGLSAYALWSLHPLAVVVLVPFAIYAKTFLDLVSRSQRELDTRQRLADESARLTHATDLDDVAQRILRMTADLLHVGEARLRFQSPRGERTISWRSEEGPDEVRPPLAATLHDSAGAQIGEVVARRSRLARGDFSPAEGELLRVIAAQAGTALERTRILADLEVSLGHEAARAALGHALAGQVSPQEAASETARVVKETLGADWVAVTGPPPLRFDGRAGEPPQTVRSRLETRIGKLAEGRATIVVAGARPDAFGAADATFLESVADLLDATLGRIRAEDALRRNERLSALGTLVAGVAHEINNPLTFVLGNIELAGMVIEDAKAPSASPQAAREALDEVARLQAVAAGGLARIGEITKSLKVVARGGTGVRSDTELRGLVENVLTVVRSRIGENVEIDVDVPPGDFVHVSPGEVSQVVLNLVLNAVDALNAQKGGRLSLRTSSEDGAVALHVADNGPGIPPEVASRLFTPFFTTKPHGTGLGLSISRQIVQDHGGTLTFVSRPGATEFTVLLPKAAPPPAEPPRQRI